MKPLSHVQLLGIPWTAAYILSHKKERWAEDLNRHFFREGIRRPRGRLKVLNITNYYCYVASVVYSSVRPHRRQPPRLPRPWDSPGKNTGVGCHFLLHCMKVKSESEVAPSFPTLSDPMDCSLPGSSVHGIFQARVQEWGAIAFSTYTYYYI